MRSAASRDSSERDTRCGHEGCCEAPGTKSSGCGAATQGCTQDFGDATTLHGIRYITQRDSHLLERICWVVAIGASALFCGFEIIKLWDRWQSSPVITSFAEHATSVTSIPFPAVTVCPESKLYRHALDLDTNLHNISRQLKGELPFDSPEQQTRVEAASLMCSSLPKVSFTPTLEHRRLMFEMAPSIEDVFERCGFQGSDMDCSKIFRTVLTNVGVCFTFNMQGDHELFTSVKAWPPVKRGKRAEMTRNSTTDSADLGNSTSRSEANPLNSTTDLEYIEDIFKISTWDPENGYTNESEEFPYREHTYLGPIGGLQVVLKTKRADIQQLCTKSNAENAQVIVHTPTEFPSPLGNYFHMSPGSQAMAVVRPTTITTEPELRTGSYSPKDRGCTFPEERDMFILSTYTKSNCVLDDLLHFIANHCHCSLLYIPFKDAGNHTFCTPTLNDGCYGSLDDYKIADCLPSCYELKYGYTVSSAKHQETQLEARTQGVKYSKLIVFFEEESFYGKRKSELYGITDFIASCGGLLGLFTGFSLISLVEVIYFATVRLGCRLHHHHRVPLATSDDN